VEDVLPSRQKVSVDLLCQFVRTCSTGYLGRPLKIKYNFGYLHFHIKKSMLCSMLSRIIHLIKVMNRRQLKKITRNRLRLFSSVCQRFSHILFFLSDKSTMKFVIASALVASAAAFAPTAQFGRTTALNQHIGSGGMADTRNPDAVAHEDPRKSISAAPSFEEYLKQRAGGDAAPAAAAPAAAAPVAAGE
jgi:hypothetical protein